MENKYERLFSPGKINSLTLKNRIVYPPMAYHSNHVTGEMSEATIGIFARRARGGAAMVITTPMYAQKRRPTMDTLAFHQKLVTPPKGQVDIRKQVSRMMWAPLEPVPALNPSMYRLVEAVHVNGGRICAHISPEPCWWTLANYDLVDPESRGLGIYNWIPTKDIEDTIEEFATVAGELKGIGFDAIEMRFAYFADCFAQEGFNKRQDKYAGKDLLSRLRYHKELITATRASVGKDFPLIAMIDADHFGAPGWRTLDETKLVVKKFEEWGVDAIRPRGGGTVKVQYDIAPMYLPKGVNIPMVEGVKSAVSIPVVATTRLADPDLAEKVLEEGKADFIAVGRGLIADPDLPNKVRAGLGDTVRKCISCNIGCLGNLTMLPRRPSRCTVNPYFGNEHILPDRVGLASRKVKVVVVGAGPGGMSAALAAAQRGHDVVLFEKSVRLGGGGHFQQACIPPFKDELLSIPEHYEKAFSGLTNLVVHMNTRADEENVLSEKPEVVIIATGGAAAMPDLPGVENSAVLGYDDVLLGTGQAGNQVVVLGGGGIGCEVTLHLLRKGKRVTILEMLPRLADHVEGATRNCLIEELQKAGAESIVGARVMSVSRNRVHYLKDGKTSVAEGDTIVAAMNSRSEDQLYRDLSSRVADLRIVGDAKEPRQIMHAVSEGFWAAYHI